MASVFNDPRYALQYEQVNLDLGLTYEHFAKDTLSLHPPGEKAVVLDLGCGTGISTTSILEIAPAARVVGIDQSPAFLEIARFKFGQSKQDDVLTGFLLNGDFYPSLVREQCNVLDLTSHLRSLVSRYRNYTGQVNFYRRDAAEIENLGQFDYVLASQVLHWFRKKDALPQQPNLEYEQRVLQQVRKVLKDKGRFGFNTSGADYAFEDEQMNKEHLLHHPFYRSFMESLYSQLGFSLHQPRPTFDHAEIERIMAANGFAIENRKQTRMLREDPRTLIETCLIGGQMQIFQKANITLSIQERELLLRTAVREALQKSSLNSVPIVETGIHYVAQKI